LIGLLLSLAVNLITAMFVLSYWAIMGLGIGMSSNPAVERDVFGSMQFVALCCPGLVNLFGLGYGLLRRQFRFLAGWGIGLLGGLIFTGLVIGCFALYVALLTR
jgi:hypothetical protein